MLTYTARFAHRTTDNAATLDISAKDEEDAIEQARKFVKDGFRNGTWISLDLAGNRTYSAWNEHGEVVSTINKDGE